MAATTEDAQNEISQTKSFSSDKEKATVTSATIVKGEAEEEWPSAVIAQKDDEPKQKKPSNPRRKSRSKIFYLLFLRKNGVSVYQVSPYLVLS